MSYKLAVIGAGGIARSHLEAAAGMPKLQTVAVADLACERAREAADAFGVRPYRDYQEMVLEEKPDIVVITLPHYLHKEAAIWCMEQGSHVLLEKPMAIGAGECDAILEAAEKCGRVLMVGHTQHYIAENIAAREIVRSGRLGELVMIHDARHVDYFTEERPAWFLEKAKSGGGILTNLGSHSIDKIQWIIGSSVTSVKASLSRHAKRGDVEGSGLIYVETASGIPATISQSGYGGAPLNETMLLFTGGMLKLRTREGLWIGEHGRFQQVAIAARKDPFVLQLEDLLQGLEGSLPPECSGSYARSVVAAVDAVYRSCETGRETAV